VLTDPLQAKREIKCAWEQYKQSTIKRFTDGLEFGRLCYEWQARYKSQGSRKGKGFEHVLEQLAIPKTTAYRWIKRYETRIGLRATRNEVENGLRRRHKRNTNIQFIDRRISFEFLLTDEQRRQLAEDVKTLGGRDQVAAMFLEFVSQKALEKRVINNSVADTSRLHVGREYGAIGDRMVAVRA
jgi:hypothetical protein